MQQDVIGTRVKSFVMVLDHLAIRIVTEMFKTLEMKIQTLLWYLFMFVILWVVSDIQNG